MGEIQLGFLEATNYGPLCSENIYGCIFILEKMHFLKDEENLKAIQENKDNSEELEIHL